MKVRASAMVFIVDDDEAVRDALAQQHSLLPYRWRSSSASLFRTGPLRTERH